MTQKKKTASENKFFSSPCPEIVIEECKSCGRCVRACPVGVLSMTNNYNRRGYHYVEYKGQGCTGCGLCFYTCPEPHAIRVVRIKKDSQ